MNRRPQKESESHLIDRLILGRPPSEQLVRWMGRLSEAGWTHEEIARLFIMTEVSVAKRLSRSKTKPRSRNAE